MFRMSYLEFDKKELINLEYSLSREVLRSNRAGSYASMSLIGCNTRKYHGLLICPMEHLDGNKHVLLSAFDLTIRNNGDEFNLGIHKYQGDHFSPRGHKYVQDFQADLVHQIYYRIGAVRILRESLLVEKEQQILIRYTILEADKKIQLQFTPFLAFRNIHQLSKANLHANTKIKHIPNGIKSKLYDGYPFLHMQFSSHVEFIQVPDWYYNIEYIKEQKRGYEYKEDLFVPGFFEAEAQKGDTIVFSASTLENNPKALKRKFTADLNKRFLRNSFKNCLLISAEQFIEKKDKKTEIIAGYHWYGSICRDTLISLPGLTRIQKQWKTFLAALDNIVKKVNKGLFPNILSEENISYATADTSLWFFWTLQQYVNETNSYDIAWNNYKKTIKNILSSYKNGTLYNIHMNENGLIFAGQHGIPLTWMNSVVNGKPVTPRTGFVVEINALWYNAVCFSLELAKKVNDTTFIKQWEKYPELISKSFIDNFWDSEKGYLADVFSYEEADWTVRPNQIIAAALDYSPLTGEMKKTIIETVERFLLTPRGLRSLAPRHPDYKGVYEGNPQERDIAYHQGTVWPWLLEFYSEAYLKLRKQSGLEHIKNIIKNFEPVMNEHGIGTISEIYDGDPPHEPKGAISKATSVAAILSVINKIEQLESF